MKGLWLSHQKAVFLWELKTQTGIYISPDLMTEKERPSFEEALKELESIVSKLEDNEITLEESVELYEKGLELSKFCNEILEKAELRIEQVNEAQE